MRSLRRAARWCFADRRTGTITIAQVPNLPIVLFGIAYATEWLLAPEGRAGALLWYVARGFLAWWAADEALRGVNPWRRALGGGVLVFLAITVATRLA